MIKTTCRPSDVKNINSGVGNARVRVMVGIDVGNVENNEGIAGHISNSGLVNVVHIVFKHRTKLRGIEHFY